MSIDHLFTRAPREFIIALLNMNVTQEKAKRTTDHINMDFQFEVALILINGWQQVIWGLDRPLTCKARSTEAVAGNMES